MAGLKLALKQYLSKAMTALQGDVADLKTVSGVDGCFGETSNKLETMGVTDEVLSCVAGEAGRQ